MSSDFTPMQLISILSVFFGLIAVVMSIYFVILRARQETKYNDEKKKIELDLMRHELESQIYALNEKMKGSTKNWNDMNHLQIDANEFSSPSAKPTMNQFLKASGLSKTDLETKDYVFVLTPFHSKYDDVYDTIKKVCSESNIDCVRGDEENFKGDIFSHVLKHIVQSKVVIANISGRNPNVMYELGLAHALDKNTIIISELLDDLPIDIQSKRIVSYKNLETLANTLPKELLKSFK